MILNMMFGRQISIEQKGKFYDINNFYPQSQNIKNERLRQAHLTIAIT